jgi:hypothetical protein
MNTSTSKNTLILITGLIVFALTPSLSTLRARPMIDVHVHTAPRYYKPLLELLGSYGISRFVNLSGGYGETLVDNLNLAAIVEPQVAVCTNIDWSKLGEADFANQVGAALEHAAQVGARCIKISKALGLYINDPTVKDDTRLLRIDHERLDPIWETAGRLGLPIFIHTGDPKAFFEPLTPENERYDELSVHPDWSFYGPDFPSRRALLEARNRVFKRFANTTFVAVHFANNPENINEVDRLLDRYPNVVVDIAARVPELGRHAPSHVRKVFTKHQDRILLGTDLGFSPRQIMLGSVGRDSPTLYDIFEFYARHEAWLSTTDQQIQHPTPIQGRWRINGAGIPSKVLDKIYWRNALRVIWKVTPNEAEELQMLGGTPDMSRYYPN